MLWNTFGKLLAFLLLFLASQNLSASPNSCIRLLTPTKEFEVEGVFQLKFAKQAEEDRAYLKELAAHPSQTSLRDRAEHIRLEQEWIAAKKRGNYNDHRREKHYRPILERIAGDLLQRQSRKYGDKHLAELKRLHKKAWNMLAEGDPLYKATARFIMLEYLPLLDKILFERHPHLAKGDYHRKNAKHLLEKFLKESPDVYLHFSFEPVDDRFFIESRPSLVNIIGIDLRGLDDVSLEPKITNGLEKGPRVPFADNFEMSISEFAWHDLGHAGFTLFRDLEFLRKSGLPIERVVAEWEGTNKAIMAMVNQAYTNGFSKPDPDLGDAMINLLFEVTRERGYQFSLSILKQELDTQKWVEVILDRKLTAGFYSHYHSNDRRFARLEEARLILLNTIGRLKEEAQLRWYAATNPNVNLIQVPVKITHFPSLTYAKGRFQKLRIDGFDNVQVDVSTVDGSKMSTPIFELASAQVNPAKVRVSSETELYLNVVLMMKERKLDSISHIEIGTDRNFIVVLKSQLQESHQVGLTDYVNDHPEMIAAYHKFTAAQEKLKAQPQKGRKKTAPILYNIDAFHMFKIDQVFGTAERNEPVAFTIRPPTRVYYGYVFFEQNLMTGQYVVHVKTANEQKDLRLPLTEVRIDSWERAVER